MSGRYGRTFSRRKTAPPPISQFDKLLTEPCSSNSTKPSAAKTAGHVGKWGITSFTSLRSINGGLGREESSKRYLDDSPPSSFDGAYSFDGGSPANGASLQVKPPVRTFSKPRKFFRSRNTEDVEPPKVPAADKGRARVGEGLYGVKAAPLASAFDTPDCSQDSSGGSQGSYVSGGGKWGSSGGREGAGRASGSVVNKSSNSQTLTSARSGSGIKLKIFKSRNVASCSQETYSSTVELPSDDSRGGSPATSAASSPSTKDLSEENRDSAEEAAAGGGSPHTQYKVVEPITLPTDSHCGAADRGATVDSFSPCRTLDSTVDSSFEFGDLVDQKTGLPLDGLCVDADTSFSGNKSNVGEVRAAYAASSKQAKGSSGGCKSVAQPGGVIDTQHGTVQCESSESSLPMDFDIFSMGPSDFVEPPKTPPAVGRVESPTTLPADGEGDGFDLFSTDFDENEIIDRTSIEFPSRSRRKPGPRDPAPDLPDTQDVVDLLFASQTSLQSPHNSLSLYQAEFKSSQSSTSEGEGAKKCDPPPLVKKRSIFKSRDADRDAKKRATYKHKWHNQEEKEEGSKEAPAKLQTTHTTSSAQSAFDDFDFEPAASLTRVQTWPTGASSGDLDDSTEGQTVTSVKCAKGAKQYYTVVKNVKRTHQLQESGEFQEFNDDVEYFLDALRSNPVSTRCLAALNLAQKCMVPAFRMHLRAHGTVIKFFSALSDAPSDHRLAICAAMVMFTLSQDRLNMDLDRDSLELMLNLLDTDADATDSVSASDDSFNQNKKKIRELCNDMQKKGHAKHLNLDNINAGHLAMETLLSLTSKRAGEWFKEELRALGGVEHLIRTISHCTDLFSPDMDSWTHHLLEKLSKVDRCLKVLENVTHQNTANQEYLLKYQHGIFPKKLLSLYRLCHVEVPLYPATEASSQNTTVGGLSTGELLVQTLLTTIKVLINLTHNPGKEALGSKMMGAEQDIYDITLYCLLIMPRYLASDKRFELIILTCCLLLNLVEHSRANRGILMKTKAPAFLDTANDTIFHSKPQKGAMLALVELFYRSEESARQQEAHTDEIIDHDLAEKTKQEDEKKEDELEETVAKLLQKAGHHMEDTLIAAYTALLTGYCIMEDEDCEKEIRAMLPDSNFNLMVMVLKKFLRFMDLTASTSLLRSLKPTERVVKYMERLDSSQEVEAEAERKKQEQQQQQQEEEEEEDKEMEFDAFGF